MAAPEEPWQDLYWVKRAMKKGKRQHHHAGVGEFSSTVFHLSALPLSLLAGSIILLQTKKRKRNGERERESEIESERDGEKERKKDRQRKSEKREKKRGAR